MSAEIMVTTHCIYRWSRLRKHTYPGYYIAITVVRDGSEYKEWVKECSNCGGVDMNSRRESLYLIDSDAGSIVDYFTGQPTGD